MVVCAPPDPQQLVQQQQYPWRAFDGLPLHPLVPLPRSESPPRDYYCPQPPAGSTFWSTGDVASMKRNLSDSEGDDVFDDVSSKGTPTQSNESCQMLNRKKRRGIIEKRRRDRINNSLTELRRLVPTAFEKQGSAKLEKAEILQMTVDHLKMLHAKGFDAFSFDPHKFAMDYHSVGFRECAAEVARYLVTVEGMDIQDPLRLRLMSHLQCYSAQRELAAKQAAHTSPWNAFSSVPSSNSSQFPSSAAGTAPPTSMIPPGPSHNSIHVPQGPHGLSDQSLSLHPGSLSCSEPHPRLTDNGPQSGLGQIPPHMRLPHTSVQSASMPSVTSSTASGSGPMMHSLGQMHPQYPMSLNINTHGFTSMSPSGYSPTSTTSQAGHSVKPYRPWGAELAY